MESNGEVEANVHLHSQFLLWNHTFNFINSMSLKCAVELGLPGIIHKHGRPITLPELVSQLPVQPTKADSVHRLMRVLVHSGLFAKQINPDGKEAYIATPLSKHLEADSAFPLAVLDQALLTPWLHLSSWFRGDERTPFQLAHGMSMWDYTVRNPGFSALFNEAMARDSSLIASKVIATGGEAFAGVRSLVDVGGGNGSVTRAIAEAFPHVKCTVFDLPHVVETLPASGEIRYVGGSMFDFIPPADAVFLKSILHDYNDDDSIKILKRCKEAIPPKEEGGKVLLVEMIVNDGKDGIPKSLETQLFFDMEMMVNHGGKERDEQQWQKIFLDAGFTGYKIKPVLGFISLIEVYP